MGKYMMNWWTCILLFFFCKSFFVYFWQAIIWLPEGYIRLYKCTWRPKA
jgi:hypothetical protein